MSNCEIFVFGSNIEGMQELHMKSLVLLQSWNRYVCQGRRADYVNDTKNMSTTR